MVSRDKEFFTVQEVAELLCVHENTVYRWIKEGTLKGVKVGDLCRIRRDDFDAFTGATTKTEG